MPFNLSLSKKIWVTPEVEGGLLSFGRKTGLLVSLLDINGCLVWDDTGLRSTADLCRCIRRGSKERKWCTDSLKKAGLESLRWGEPFIGTCCRFFIQMTVPVMINERLTGYLRASPFMMMGRDDLQPEEISFIAKNCKKLERPEEAILDSIPVLNGKAAGRAADELFNLADLISEPDLRCLIRVRETQRLQGRIADRILDLKTLNETFDALSLTKLSWEQEKELLASVRLGDKKGAQEILFNLLAIILSRHLDNFDLLKISILELFTVLFRIAGEAGASMEDVLGMKYDSITDLAVLQRQEDLCVWIAEVFEKIFNSIRQEGGQQDERLSKALNFIQSNCDTPLTVEDVANHVALSASRLRHIMKAETGFSLRDHIIQARISKAKSLLIGANLSIAEVAHETGYFDQSHFTKCFKHLERCTPHTFRKRHAS